MEEALNLGKKKTASTTETDMVNVATGERAKQGIVNRAMEEGEES